MKIYDVIEKSVKEALISESITLLEENPEKNANKMFNLVKKFTQEQATLSSYASSVSK